MIGTEIYIQIIHRGIKNVRLAKNAGQWYQGDVLYAEEIFLVKTNIWTGSYNMTEITMIGGFLAIYLILSYLENKYKEEDRTHHDNQSYSHYKISQQVLRDARRYD